MAAVTSSRAMAATASDARVAVFAQTGDGLLATPVAYTVVRHPDAGRGRRPGSRRPRGRRDPPQRLARAGVYRGQADGTLGAEELYAAPEPSAVSTRMGSRSAMSTATAGSTLPSPPRTTGIVILRNIGATPDPTPDPTPFPTPGFTFPPTPEPTPVVTPSPTPTPTPTPTPVPTPTPQPPSAPTNLTTSPNLPGGRRPGVDGTERIGHGSGDRLSRLPEREWHVRGAPSPRSATS